MRKLQILIILCTVLLVGYTTWGTIAQLDAIANLTCTNLDKYDKYFYGKDAPCNLTGNNPSGRKSLSEIFGYGYTKEEVTNFQKEVSDSVVQRGVFLDGIVLLTGSFAFITVSKLQSKKGGVNEAKGKSKGKT